MAINTPPINQMNAGWAIQKGQQIKYNQMRNQAVGMELEEKQDMLANRRKAQGIREMYDAMPAQIEAMDSQGLFDEADKLRNNYIDTRIQEVNLLTGMRPQIDETNYKQIRQDLIQSGSVMPEIMPVEYSDDWFRNSVEEKKGDLGKLTRKWADQGVTFSQDLIQQDGDIVWTGDPYQGAQDKKAAAGGGGGGGGAGKAFTMKSADSNSIRSHVRSLYGSNFNPATQKFDVLNRREENEVAAIQAEASRIYNANQGMLPHAEAVARAARKLQIEIRDLQNDPANRNPLGFPNR